MSLAQGMQSSAVKAHKDFHRNGRQKGGPTSSEKPSAYRAILESSLPPQEKEANRLSQEVVTLLIGGAATTARVMTRLTVFLTTDPAILRRLREELEQVMPDPPVVLELEDLEELPYLVSLQFTPKQSQSYLVSLSCVIIGSCR